MTKAKLGVDTRWSLLGLKASILDMIAYSFHLVGSLRHSVGGEITMWRSLSAATGFPFQIERAIERGRVSEIAPGENAVHDRPFHGSKW